MDWSDNKEIRIVRFPPRLKQWLNETGTQPRLDAFFCPVSVIHLLHLLKASLWPQLINTSWWLFSPIKSGFCVGWKGFTHSNTFSKFTKSKRTHFYVPLVLRRGQSEVQTWTGENQSCFIITVMNKDSILINSLRCRTELWYLVEEMRCETFTLWLCAFSFFKCCLPFSDIR